MNEQMRRNLVIGFQGRLRSANLGLEAVLLGLGPDDALRERLELVRGRVQSEAQRLEELEELLVYRLSIEFPMGGTNELARSLKGQQEESERVRTHLRVLDRTLGEVISAMESGSEVNLDATLLALLTD